MGTPGKWGGTWSFDDSAIAQTLVDDWDTERNNGNSLNASDFVKGDPNDATTSYRYDLANIFMLASPYGVMAQVQSGYRFTDENAAPFGCFIPVGTSATDCTSAFVSGVAQAPTSRTTPTNGWDFIHRWTDISNMVKFNTAVHGTSMNTWTVGTNNQIAFSRAPASSISSSGTVTAGAALGFVALNNESSSWNTTFATGLPAGTYCNILNGRCRRGRRQWQRQRHRARQWQSRQWRFSGPGHRDLRRTNRGQPVGGSSSAHQPECNARFQHFNQPHLDRQQPGHKLHRVPLHLCNRNLQLCLHHEQHHLFR
jgi:hypothetical protein